MKTLDDVDAMRRQLPKTGLTPGQQTLMKELDDQREFLTKQQAKREQEQDARRQREEQRRQEEQRDQEARRQREEQRKQREEQRRREEQRQEEEEERRREERQRQRDERRRRPRDEGPPRPEVRPRVTNQEAWEGLRQFAENLPARTAGERQHSMLDHLRQRLGNQQRGKRPPVKVRRMDGDTIRYEEVTPDNVQAVLRAAEANTTWGQLNDADRRRLKNLTDNWQPFVPLDSEIDARTDKWCERLTLNKREFDQFDPSDESTGPAVETFRPFVRSAVERLMRWIEPEVLDLIGLPKITVHGPLDKAMVRGYYLEETQEIHLKADRFTGDLLAHEFGHHLEEQGPAEVWCGLASLLNALSGERPLNPVYETETTEPSYGWDWDSGAKPNLPAPQTAKYAMMYYPDAATELIALGFESRVLETPKSEVKWHDDRYSDLDPRYFAQLLQAVRPKEVKEKGVTLPALL